jgi:puromycin-sensitive aminopeptidase
MENWGLITFAETALLVHPSSGSQSGRQYAALLIAHEIAHQWFGNIVTMRWWSQLWLNEGFASWAEYFCVDALFPDWKMWDQYLGVRFAFSLAADALEHSHALEVPMATPADIDENFDAVSYSKGSVAVRMMQQALGPEEFRRAISKYLKWFAYSNAVTAKWAKHTGYLALWLRIMGRQKLQRRTAVHSQGGRRDSFPGRTRQGALLDGNVLNGLEYAL